MHTLTTPRARRAPARPPGLHRAITHTAGMPRPPRPVGHVVETPEQTAAQVLQLRDNVARAERELYDYIESERAALRLTVASAADLLGVSKPTLDRRLRNNREQAGGERGGGERK